MSTDTTDSTPPGGIPAFGDDTTAAHADLRRMVRDMRTTLEGLVSDVRALREEHAHNKGWGRALRVVGGIVITLGAVVSGWALERSTASAGDHDAVVRHEARIESQDDDLDEMRSSLARIEGLLEQRHAARMEDGDGE